MARGTRTRRSTHGRALVTHARCPKCSCQHVTETPIHGIPTRTCGMCGHQWTPDPPTAEEDP
jgi:Zn ribbon nucleic-acid-binding protein